MIYNINQYDFPLKVNITWSKDKAGPSEKISLKINVTEPKTSVALLIVDKSTKLLGKRSDITEDVVSLNRNF